MHSMFVGFDPSVIRAAGRLANVDVVMDGDGSKAELALQDWASGHLEMITDALHAKLRARAVWTRVISRRDRATLVELAKVAHRRADSNRSAAESWRGQVDDEIVDEWRDQGLALADDEDAASLEASARSSFDTPAGATMLLAALVVAIFFILTSAGRNAWRHSGGRLARLPSLSLTPRLAARPRAALSA